MKFELAVCLRAELHFNGTKQPTLIVNDLS
jgi:hypothetical protein